MISVSVPRLLRLCSPLLLALPLLGAAPGAQLEISIERLRNANGIVHLCLTRATTHFPNCGDDPAAVKRSAPASGARTIGLALDPGSYALSIIHDENRNGKLDTFLRIPREGFGFSRNPVIRFGPPRFEQVRFAVAAGMTRQTVRMQYLL